MNAIEIDGSTGEGGGQILRTALALALHTGRELHMTRIRARRAKPGLMRQHRVAVNAAVAISTGEATGADVGSTELTFRPGAVRGGSHTFSIGTAGSTTLVLQTVLLPLLLAREPSELVLEGGTHNPLAPTFDYLRDVYLPLLARMNAHVEIALERHGFYPAGGGRFVARISPCQKLGALELLERGDVRAQSATALVANLPRSIAARELSVLGEELGWPASSLRVESLEKAIGPGNVVSTRIESAHVTEIFTSFGEKGVNAETVARSVARDTRSYLACTAPVGEHLADQLVLPMALGAGGSYRATTITPHCASQFDLVTSVLGAHVATDDEGPERGVRVTVTPA